MEFFIGNLIPAVLPTAILGPRVHLVTTWTWVAMRIGGTTANHSGYDLPWLPWDIMPMRSTPEYHDFHHSGGDFSGNFSGQTTVLDTIWGTNKKYYESEKKKKLD